MPDDRTIRFSRHDACRLVGVAPERLRQWERWLPQRRPDRGFAFSELLGLAILLDLADRLDIDLGRFDAGIRLLFPALAEAAEADRLGEFVVVLGPTSARIDHRTSLHAPPLPQKWVLAPIHPFLASLREQVFS
ncbi:MAG TPA: hypothetical protein VG939_04495 [Caulobacteraceae bacterium]|nr:hypothetical protein [Caulobacteraceae bacterium]